MNARGGIWKLVAAFVVVSAASLAITGLRVDRDVLPLVTIAREEGNVAGPVMETDAKWLTGNPAVRFVVTYPMPRPFQATVDGLDLIASGKGDPLVATATVECAILYCDDSCTPPEVVKDPPADRLGWFVGVVDRAKIADPGNGWFDLVASTKLLEASLEEVKVAEGEAPKAPPRILDEARFRAGLARLDAAATAPFVDSRHVERMTLRARFVRSEGMESISQLIGTWASTLLPEIRFYRSVFNFRLLPWLETSATPDEAVKRTAQVTFLMKQVRRRSKVLIEWLVARVVEKRSLETLSRIHAAAGRVAESRELARRARRMDQWREERDSSGWEAKLGSLDTFLMPGTTTGAFDTDPGRELDWAVLEEAVFAALVAMLFLWGLAGVVRAFFARRIEPADAGPAAARPWTLCDLAAVALPGALLPAVFFVVFNRTHPSREFGSRAAGATFIVQMVTLLPAVALLLSWLLRRSLAGTAGAPIPRRLPVGLFAVSAACAGIAFFWLNAPPCGESWLLFLLPVISGIALLVAMASGLACLRRDSAGGSLGRAQIAAALASVVVVTLTHLVIVQPHADSSIARYKSAVLGPWMQNEVQRVVDSNRVLLWEAEEETK